MASIYTPENFCTVTTKVKPELHSTLTFEVILNIRRSSVSTKYSKWELLNLFPCFDVQVSILAKIIYGFCLLHSATGARMQISSTVC